MVIANDGECKFQQPKLSKNLDEVEVLEEDNSGGHDLCQDLEFGNILNLLFLSVFFISQQSQVLNNGGGLLSFRFSDTLSGTY